MSRGRTRQSATRLAHLLVTLLFLLSLAPSFVTAQENTGPAAAPLTLQIDAAANRTAISPNIYGMNYPNASLASELKLPLQRWGGNATSRYNYLADISNRGSDWFFENVPEIWGSTPPNLPSGSSVDQFITRGRSSGTKTLMTIPMMGWVARTDSPRDHPLACGFSTAKYGAQAQTDSFSTHCGLGRRADGSLVTGNDPADTSMAIDPTFVKGWIKHLTSTFGDANNGGVRYYNLDNEPSLWHETHRDIRPTPLGYAELRDRTYAYAAAVKAADPGARTLGPAEWGWNGYFYSARDSHSNNANPDRAAYGNKPLVQWYLEQMRAYEQQHGVRILDYLDLHYYPQASGVALSGAGDATTQARRLRSTRSLWDPNYSDESWIASQPDGPAVRLIPRMRDWVNTYYPGTKLAITEYNWGALDHINGALAQADVLGIFGRENVDMALLWDPPAPTDPGAYAFRMYLNYDGKGSAFGTTSVKATSSDQDRVAVYAATSGSTLTLMVINKGNAAETTTLNLANFTPASSAAVYRYSEANLGAITQEASLSVGSSFSATFPQRSITLLVLNKSGSGQPASSNTVYLPLVIRSPKNQLSENPTPAPTTPTPGPTTPTTPTPAPKTPTPAPTTPTPKTPTPTPTTPTDPVAGTVRIMPLGDSITEGVNGGYRVGLWNRLVGDGYKLDYVGPRYDQYTKVPDKDHAGTPGFTTGNILSNIDGYMDSYKPQVVTLMIGTNDLAWWIVEGSGPVANRLGQIIDRIHAKSPTTYVVVASIAPMEGTVQPNGLSRATLVKEYNAAIRQQVSTRASAGKRVSFADVNGALTMGDLYDGVHPTEAAHDKIAQVWYNAVKPLLAKP